jgi:hypothetical protein
MSRIRLTGAVLSAVLVMACASSQPPGEEADAAAAAGDASSPGSPDAGQAGCPLTDPDDDGDGVCNSVDACPGEDDTLDADSDMVADGCDVCAGSNDAQDIDGDGVPDGCDVCAGADDTLDADNDSVPNDCDQCPGFDDSVDPDVDGVPDGCDACQGFDDAFDADNDTVPDGCDICPGFVDSVDNDNDAVPDGCDACPGFDDSIDNNNNGTPDGCDCDTATEVDFNGTCYYLDGSGGVCEAGYVLAPQSILTSIATMFVGKNYKNTISGNCCVQHANQATELQDWGMSAQCNSAGPFTVGPVLGGAGCSNANQLNPTQLTLCQSSP